MPGRRGVAFAVSSFVVAALLHRHPCRFRTGFPAFLILPLTCQKRPKSAGFLRNFTRRSASAIGFMHFQKKEWLRTCASF